MEEQTYSFNVEFDFTWLILALIAYFLVKAIIKFVKAGKSTVQVPATNDQALTTFTVVGGENTRIIGMMYEGKRIPDVEIVNRELFIDGKKKRKLARNSQVYNRGVGIFVDGKYVG